MRLHPSQRSTDLGLIAALLVAVGIATERLSLLSLGIALFLGLFLARAYVLVSVARARAAGFEMVWLTGTRVVPTNRLLPTELSLEIRNRDDGPTWFRDLKMLASPLLEVRVEPEAARVPAGGSILIKVIVRPLRVGHHGIHGVSLNAVRAPGLYLCPLSFTSPLVVSVSPREERRAVLRRNQGFSPDRFSPDGTLHRAHEGEDFRELREHRSGDAFRKIAWKASARRGRLLVVETETRAPELTYLLVDGSVEGWHGAPGTALLDHGIDHILRAAEALVSRGDRVGLVIAAGRRKIVVEPNHGPVAVREIRKALAFETHTMDEDQSEWDAPMIRDRVFSHLRTLEPKADRLERSDQDALLALVAKVENDAPTAPSSPYAQSRTDARLRRYLLAYGITSPPTHHGERHRTLGRLAEVTLDLVKTKRKPTSLHYFVFAPLPEIPPAFLSALDQAKRRGVKVEITPYGPRRTLVPEGVSLEPSELLSIEENNRLQFERSLSLLKRRAAVGKTSELAEGSDF